MLTYPVDCDECGSLAVRAESDPHNPVLMHMYCRECGAEWQDYDD